MAIRDIMTKSVKVIPPDAWLVQAAEVMEQEDLGALPVVEENRMMGMLTDRDIVVRCVAYGKDPAQTRVMEAMTPEFAFVYEDEDVNRAAQLMAERQIRRLPVLDRDRRLVGIVSIGDVARLSRDKKMVGGTLSSVSH